MPNAVLPTLVKILVLYVVCKACGLIVTFLLSSVTLTLLVLNSLVAKCYNPLTVRRTPRFDMLALPFSCLS